MKRRIIAALMALCLCIGLLPATALAVEGPTDRSDSLEITKETTRRNGLSWSNVVAAEVGDEITYEITIENHANEAATDVVVSDSFFNGKVASVQYKTEYYETDAGNILGYHSSESQTLQVENGQITIPSIPKNEEVDYWIFGVENYPGRCIITYTYTLQRGDAAPYDDQELVNTASVGSKSDSVSVTVQATGGSTNDSEFHIMDWEALKDFVREAYDLEESEKITIHAIKVNGETILDADGSATGGAANYTNKGDYGVQGLNGILAADHDIWKVFNDAAIIKPETVTSITVLAKTGTGSLGFRGEELQPLTIYLSEDDIVLPVDNGYITQIYLKDASLEPIPPEQVGYTIHYYYVDGEGTVTKSSFVDSGTAEEVTNAEVSYCKVFSALPDDNKPAGTYVFDSKKSSDSFVWTMDGQEFHVYFALDADGNGTPDYQEKDDITGFEKALVTGSAPEGVSIPGGVTVEYPASVEETVKVPADSTVTLMYQFTVEGVAGTSFTIMDNGAVAVGGDYNTETSASGTISGVVPDSGTAVIYVIKTFAANEIDVSSGTGYLTNHATISVDEGDTIADGEDQDDENVPAEITIPLDVYVYLQVEGSGQNGELTEEDLATISEWGLEKSNPDDYYILGKLSGVGLPEDILTDGELTYEKYATYIKQAFTGNKFTAYKENSVIDEDFLNDIAWENLVWASGAPGYESETQEGNCLHLDGVLKLKSSYDLTYDANGGTIGGNPTFVVNNIALADAKSYTLGQEENPAYADPEHDAANGKTVLFAGWTTDGSAQDQIYSVKDAKNGSVPAAVNTVDLTKNDTVYALWSYDEDKDGTPDINEIIVTPADITIYTGGDSYTGEIVDSNGVPVTSGEDEMQDYNGFPEPGFYITLPTALNDQLRGDTTGPVDLSGDLSFVYSAEGQPGKAWSLAMYNPDSPSNIAFSKFVYRMTPAEGQKPVRLQIVGEDRPISDDRLENFGTDNLFETYTMSIYGGDVRTDAVKARLTINGVTQSCDIYVDSGVLSVRGTTESADTVAINDSTNDANGFQATAADSNNYYINGSNIEVAAQDVHLLTDKLTGGQEQLNQLQEKAETPLKNAGITETDGLTYDFMYLDLVDSSNGNAYVTLNQNDENHSVTIHWPIPNDADPNGEFYVVHFDGLDRDYDVTDLDDLLNNPKNPDKVQVITYTKTDDSLKVSADGKSVSFKTSTFSPFALVYEQKDGTTPTQQYTVEFKPGDHGSLLGTTIFHVNAGDSVISVPTVNENSNYDFTVWLGSDNKTYSKNDILSLEINSNMTFTAQYRYTGDSGYDPKEARLHFNSRGGTEFEDEVRKEPFNYNPYENIPSRPGYRFTGWYDSSRLDDRYDEDEEIFVRMGTTTVFAGWEETSVPSMLNGDDHYAYIQGYSDGTVRPNANITRAQVATIFFRLLDEDVRDDNLTTYNTFPDVDEDYWANTAISTMASLGVINGRNSGLFDPDAYITRAEFAAICARFDDSGVDGITTFTDTVGHWAEDEISRAAALGWIQGYSDGTFRPNQYITRAQAVTMINRVLCRLPEDTDDLLSGMNTWTDCHEDDWFYLAIQEATNSHDFVAKDRVYESWTDLNRAPDWSRYE